MRESIGGTMLFWIVLFFLSIFITFLAFVIRYAHVYRIKNSVINYIERREGVETVDDFRGQLMALGYPSDRPIMICKNTIYKSGQAYGLYYTIELRADFQIPIVYVNVPIRIKGETRTIKTGTLIESTEGTNIVECSSIDGY